MVGRSDTSAHFLAKVGLSNHSKANQRDQIEKGKDDLAERSFSKSGEEEEKEEKKKRSSYWSEVAGADWREQLWLISCDSQASDWRELQASLAFLCRLQTLKLQVRGPSSTKAPQERRKERAGVSD